MKPVTEQYRENFEKGLQYQDFAIKKLYEAGLPLVCYTSFKYQTEVGENAAGVEIKYDGRMAETGRVYFETAEKADAANKAFVPSGIFREDNTWLYAIGDYTVLYLCGKTHLRQLFGRESEKSHSFAQFAESPTSRGMILPQNYVEARLALKTIKFSARRGG